MNPIMRNNFFLGLTPATAISAERPLRDLEACDEIKVLMLLRNGLLTQEIAMIDPRPNNIAALCPDDDPYHRPQPLARCLLAVRRWGPLVASIACLFFFLGHLAGAAQRPENVLRARAMVAERFELVGPDGKRAAVLNTDDIAGTSLDLFDKRGHPRLRIGLGLSGYPFISLYDSKGQNRLYAGLSVNDEMPNLALYGPPPLSSAIHMRADEIGASLGLTQTNGGRLSLAVDDQRQPSVDMSSAGDQHGVYISAGAQGQQVSLTGKGGVRRVRLKMLPDGSPEVELADETGEVISVTTLTKDGKAISRRPAK
jgi:hypothetical protein